MRRATQATRIGRSRDESNDHRGAPGAVHATNLTWVVLAGTVLSVTSFGAPTGLAAGSDPSATAALSIDDPAAKAELEKKLARKVKQLADCLEQPDLCPPEEAEGHQEGIDAINIAKQSDSFDDPQPVGDNQVEQVGGVGQ